MPTYDYACQACDHRFELVQSFTDDPISICPICEKETVKKVFAVPAIAFKGSGFYKTDSRTSSTTTSNTTKAESSTTTSDSGSSAGSDSKKSSDSSSGGSAPKTDTKNSTSSSKSK